MWETGYFFWKKAKILQLIGRSPSENVGTSLQEETEATDKILFWLILAVV